MREGWTYKKLGDCLSYIKNGANIKQTKGAMGIPITRIETLSGGVFNRDRLGYADIFSADKYSQSILDDGDILMSHINSKAYIGRSVLYRKEDDEQIIHGMNLLRLKVIPSILLPSYLNISFQSDCFRDEVAKIRKDAVNQSSMAISDLTKILIPVPPLSEQERIVSELDILSSIIEKRKAQLKEYDQLSESIFYGMFGDPIENPKGWEVKKLGEIGTIVAGSTPSTNDDSNWDGNVNWVTPAELGEQLYYGETVRKLTEKGAKGLTIMPVGTVLLSSRAPIGKLAITTVPMCCNQGFKNIICLDSINNVFLYFFLKNTMNMVQALGRGATFKEVSKSAINSYHVLLPPLSLQQQFAEKIEAIERQKELIKQSIKETETLFNSRMDYYFN